MTSDARAEWLGLDRKLVAILRGVRPTEAEAIIAGFFETGFRAVEVPLNSPDPFRSIEIAARLAEHVPDAIVGAGTVLTPEDVARVADVGGRLVVSPNTDTAVIEATVTGGLTSMPGCFTATEALAAARAGAAALKFFPASLLGPGGIKAIDAVLPSGTPLIAVGGVSDKDFQGYLAAGVDGFGLGSSLYKPGDAAAEIKARAARAVAAYDDARKA